jgi:membrane associated rhomboid family serine protease
VYSRRTLPLPKSTSKRRGAINAITVGRWRWRGMLFSGVVQLQAWFAMPSQGNASIFKQVSMVQWILRYLATIWMISQKWDKRLFCLQLVRAQYKDGTAYLLTSMLSTAPPW